VGCTVLFSLFFMCYKLSAKTSRSDEVQQMLDKLKEEEEKLKKAQNTITVMTMLKEGSVPDTLPVTGKFTSSCCV